MKPGRWIALAGAALLATGLAGCINPFQPRVGTAQAVARPRPQPTSPQQLIRLFQWCYENRAIAEYEELFTDDFRFAFARVDAATYPPAVRDEEVAIARGLFVDGKASEPRANRITLDLSSPLLPLPDSRPNKPDPWHKEITTHVVLTVERDIDRWEITGFVTFYVVRGDSALLPQVLIDRGFGSDSSRWYIERWEDKTDQGQLATAAGETFHEALRSIIGAPASARSSARGQAAPIGLGRAPAPATQVSPVGANSADAGRMTWGELKLLYLDRGE